jgi:hypothetical protein
MACTAEGRFNITLDPARTLHRELACSFVSVGEFSLLIFTGDLALVSQAITNGCKLQEFIMIVIYSKLFVPFNLSQ